MGVNQDILDLQKQINDLKQKETPFTTSVTTNPFSKLGELKEQQGSTGSARIRRLHLALAGRSDGTGDTFVKDSHGSLSNTTHFELPNSATTDIYFETILVPTDYVPSTIITINWLYSNEGTSGDVKWDPLIRSLSKDATSLKSLYSSDFVRTVPSVANTTDLVSVLLEGFPERDTFITGFIRRLNAGGDTNSSSTQLWCAWIEYLASD